MRVLREIVTATANHSGPGVLVQILVRPLPDIARQVHYTKRAGAAGEGIHISRRTRIAALVRRRHDCGVRFIAPGEQAPVGPLGGVLPFPFVWQAFPSPMSIGTGIFKADPSDGLVAPAGGKGSISPAGATSPS